MRFVDKGLYDLGSFCTTDVCASRQTFAVSEKARCCAKSAFFAQGFNRLSKSDSAARGVIEAGGYGERFFHRVGHGLGLEGHEDPSLDPGSQRILEAGMVFTIEPGIYIPGFGGVRIEDDVLVEDDGCRVLTKADRSLRVITTH